MIRYNIKKLKDPRFLVTAGIVVVLLAVCWVLFLSSNTSAPSHPEALKSEKKSAEAHAPAAKDNGSAPNEKVQTEGQYAGWKAYRTITESNLSFYYPADWHFVPPKEVVTNNVGGKYNSMTLYSAKPAVQERGGAPMATNQFMCITIDEYKGDWPYNDPVNRSVLASEEFVVGQTPLLLTTYKGELSMENVIGVSLKSAGEHGTKFIPLKNGYFAMFTAQYNCLQGGEDIRNPDADFATQPETLAAKKVLKSISY